MRVPRLFLEQSLTSGETIELPRDKAHHLTHVLRMQAGHHIKLFNNSAYEYDAVIIELLKKSATVEIKAARQLDNESPLKITLCLAVSRGQHMDYSIQKAVELGVHAIIPVMSEFSNVKIQSERVQNKMQHWQNIIISAAEQSGRTKLPELSTPVSLTECLTIDSVATRLILHPGSQQAMSAIKLNHNELNLLIGPEGGFSETEVQQAIEKEVIPVRMGPRILRAETAVVSALSNAQQLWGDLN